MRFSGNHAGKVSEWLSRAISYQPSAISYQPSAFRSAARQLGVLLIVTAALALASGCGEEDPMGDNEQTAAEEEATSAVPEGEELTEETTVGPVTATVSVQPRDPQLGDRVRFEVRVTAKPDVDVEMPAFGEQLGRFDIVDFQEDAGPGTDGGTVAWQRYTLDLPMSGRQRIPPLLVEFLDRRPDRPSDVDEDEYQELLTEELVVNVESVLPEGQVATELRPVRGPLPKLETSAESLAIWPWVAGGSGLALAIVLSLWWLMGRTETGPRIPPHEVALQGLEELGRSGLPSDEEEADRWYVVLSNIIRRYVEERYGLRAPELTTEEFLREARTSRHLTDQHRDMLSKVLVIADQVKFAGYVPSAAESEEALTSARRFVEESRPKEELDEAEADADGTPRAPEPGGAS